MTGSKGSTIQPIHLNREAPVSFSRATFRSPHHDQARTPAPEIAVASVSFLRIPILHHSKHFVETNSYF